MLQSIDKMAEPTSHTNNLFRKWDLPENIDYKVKLEPQNIFIFT